MECIHDRLYYHAAANAADAADDGSQKAYKNKNCINYWENLSISLKKIFACLYRRQKLIRADKLFYPCRRYFSTV